MVGLQQYVCFNLITVVISLTTLMIVLPHILPDRKKLATELSTWIFMLMNWFALFSYLNRHYVKR